MSDDETGRGSSGGEDHGLPADATQPMHLPGIGRDPDCHEAADGAGLQDANLVVVSGSDRIGESYHVAATTTIGRSPDSVIFLDDVTVSREHAVVFNDAAGVRIEDKASLNGTFVNGERVERSELRDGDTIQVGKYRFSYVEST